MELCQIFNLDGYKNFHHKMYPEGMTKLYSNFTARSFKHLGCDKAVFFGLQYYLKEYLINQWNETFFKKSKEEVVKESKRFHKSYSGIDFDTSHIEKLHDLGYMPLEIKALPEGALINEKVPFFTITNTHPDFAWLVNYLETQMSNSIWDLCVVATISRMYKEKLNNWADKTCDDRSHVQWQAHDFSQRGRSSFESSLNQAGHLLSFTGTDTIPSIFMLEKYYNANLDNELIGASVPASEHSCITAYGKEDEIIGFERMLDIFPEGILSLVSDSFDLFKVCTEYVSTLKDKIMSRNGKLVIRPDSGDPVDIVCGLNTRTDYLTLDTKPDHPANKGVVELLWDIFGGSINNKGYKVLDPHIGVIYGDSINLDRCERICQRLAAKGFASSNIVLGVGSFTFNHNTRDSLGIAVKSTWCEVDGVARPIFKDPVTDDGIKKSSKGLLRVDLVDGEYVLRSEVTREEEQGGELKTVYKNGQLVVDHTLAQIRSRLNG